MTGPKPHLPAGTRVRTPHGFGTVTHPNAVPVLLDVPATCAQLKVMLIPRSELEVIDDGRAGQWQ